MKNEKNVNNEIGDIAKKREDILTDIKAILGKDPESFGGSIGNEKFNELVKETEHLAVLEKAKGVCNKLINEVINAQDSAERAKLRRQLSYQISKVRKVLAEIEKDPNNSVFTAEFNNEVSDIRKKISGFVRIDKRGKIEEIKASMDKNGALTPEELKDLEKERKYFQKKHNEMAKMPDNNKAGLEVPAEFSDEETKTPLGSTLNEGRGNSETIETLKEMFETGKITIERTTNYKTIGALENIFKEPIKRPLTILERNALIFNVEMTPEEKQKKFELIKGISDNMKKAIEEILVCSDDIKVMKENDEKIIMRDKKVWDLISFCIEYQKLIRGYDDITARLKNEENGLITEEIVALVNKLYVPEKFGRYFKTALKCDIGNIKSYSMKIQELDDSKLLSQENWQQQLKDSFKEVYKDRKEELTNIVVSNQFGESINNVRNAIIQMSKWIVEKTKAKNRTGTLEKY